jgi:cystathionine beta-lyase/cystathionine gamma-synthase
VRHRLPGGFVSGIARRPQACISRRTPTHPDASDIRRLLPPGLYGAIVSFELKGAGRAEVSRFMNALRMIVRATSLGDVHSMMLGPQGRSR